MGALFHGARVALKAARASSSTSHVKCLKSIAHELRLFRRLRHPNIVLFYGACIDPANLELILVLEHVHGPTLGKFVEMPPGAPETDQRCKLLNDVCCALRYLHSHRPSI